MLQSGNLGDREMRRHARADGNRSSIGTRAFLLAVLLVFVALAGAAVTWGVHVEFSVREFEQIIRSWGMWGVLASIALMVAHSFVPFPAELLALANGMIYGPLWGTAITWTGAMLGAVLAFALARALGRPFVEIVVARRNLDVLDEWAAKKGAVALLVSRFIPVISFNLINYAAGLTRIPLWTFLWATGLGILPLTVAMVVMGDRIESLSWQLWLLLGAAAAIAVLFVLRHKLRLTRTAEGAFATKPESRPQLGE